MRPLTDSIADRLAEVGERIARAAARAGRRREEITLIAVTKVFPASVILDGYEAGLREFGENYVQEAAARWPRWQAAHPDVRLHMIGAIQSNKARDVVALFDVIETVDRPKLARALIKEMARQDRRLPCFIQVNTGEEPQKAGVWPDDADAFIEECRGLGLPVIGLMAIPPLEEEPSLHFVLLAEIAKRNGLKALSMGMSHDFEVAIQFGATHVRVGTAIFGPRPPRRHRPGGGER